MRALSSYAVLALALLIASGCGGDDASTTPAGMNGGGQGGAGAAASGTGGASAAGGTSGANGGESGTAGTTGGTNATGGSSGEGGASGISGAGDGGAGNGSAGDGDAGDGGAGTSGGGMDGSLSGAGGGDPYVGMLSDAECTLEEQWSCKVCEDQDESCLVPELTNNGDGTISSACCGHVWQAEPLFVKDPERPNDDCLDREDDTGCFTWEEAHDYCAGLELAGGGFRLPKAVEMRTLFVRGMRSPYIDREAFPNIPTGDLYWTASESELSANEAWCAGFNGTFSGRRQKNTKHLVLCIR